MEELLAALDPSPIGPYTVRTKERFAMRTKDKRREMRLSAIEDDLLVEAAGLAGVTVTEFLLDRAISDAAAIVEAHHAIRMNEGDYRAFLAVLDEPSPPPAALVAQARKARPVKRVD